MYKMRKINSHFKLMALLFIIILYSCTTGSEYNRSELHRKTLEGKKTWSQEPLSETVFKRPDSEWWKGFHDKYLNNLIQDAVTGSLDIDIRLSHVKEAELSMSESKAPLFPNVNLSGNTSYFLQKTEKVDVSEPILNQNDLEDKIEDSVSTVEDSEYYNLGLNVNWEFDIWGKKKKIIFQ